MAKKTTTTTTAATTTTTAATAIIPESVGGVTLKDIAILKGVTANWTGGGTFPITAKDGNTFKVTAAVAAEYKAKDGKIYPYAALLCEFTNGIKAPVSIKALVRQRVCNGGILTPQGDLSAAILAETATDAADAAKNIAATLKGKTLTLRRIPYVNEGKAASLCEAYLNGAEAAAEDERLTRI